jgi:hypothetical protein
MEALSAQRFHQVGVQLIQKVIIERRGQIVELSGLQATKMIMHITAAIITGGTARVRKLVCQAGIDQRLQRLVNGRQTDVGQAAMDGLIDLLRRGVFMGGTQIFEHGGTLTGETPAGCSKGAAQHCNVGL